MVKIYIISISYYAINLILLFCFIQTHLFQFGIHVYFQFSKFSRFNVFKDVLRELNIFPHENRVAYPFKKVLKHAHATMTQRQVNSKIRRNKYLKYYRKS